MMSKYLLILFLLLGANSFAQPDSVHLYLVHPKNGDSIKIKQGRRIRVWKSEDDKIKGKYTIASDSTIMINNEIYPLADLNSIKCSTKEDMFGSAVSGLLPVVLTVVGIYDLANDTQLIGTKLFFIETGIGLTGIAGCTYGFLYGRQRKIAKGWRYAIK